MLTTVQILYLILSRQLAVAAVVRRTLLGPLVVPVVEQDVQPLHHKLAALERKATLVAAQALVRMVATHHLAHNILAVAAEPGKLEMPEETVTAVTEKITVLTSEQALVLLVYLPEAAVAAYSQPAAPEERAAGETLVNQRQPPVTLVIQTQAEAEAPLLMVAEQADKVGLA
jgi:hypothetical protein